MEKSDRTGVALPMLVLLLTEILNRRELYNRDKAGRKVRYRGRQTGGGVIRVGPMHKNHHIIRPNVMSTGLFVMFTSVHKNILVILPALCNFV